VDRCDVGFEVFLSQFIRQAHTFRLRSLRRRTAISGKEKTSYFDTNPATTHIAQKIRWLAIDRFEPLEFWHELEELLKVVSLNVFLHFQSNIDFYFAGVAAVFARGTGVCFSTWLAVAHSAVMPKSTSQTSPRRAFGMFGLSFVVGLEGFVGGSNQIRFRLDAASVVVNNSAAALAELVVNGPFDLTEFLGG
jgi:hypothetical protein